MLVIPFANPLGPQSGAVGDGVLFGSLPRVPAVTVLSQGHLVPFTKVYRGNADALGAVTFSNVTTAANSEAVGDVSLFDTVNPTADRLCIELSTGDELNGVSLLVSTAAVLTGTPVADVYYRTATGWASAGAIVTPSLTSSGLKKIGFTEVKYSDISPIDDLIDPRNGAQMRCLFVQFSGITAVTTAPLFSRVFKNIQHTAGHKSANLTALLAQGANPNFATAQASVLPVANDLTLFGFDEKPVRLFPTIYRPGDVSHAREWVYSTTAEFTALPAANLSDPSARLEAALALNPVAHQLINLTSTLATGTWGSSGIASTETLVGDGYLEFKVGANATLAAMVGFSTTNLNAHYNTIGWAIHVGHGATAFVSQWMAGVQQAGGTRAIVTGDVLRLERRNGVFSIYQNGVFQHEFSLQSTAPVLVDMAFIFLCGITDFILVNRSTVPEVPVSVTWKDNVAVTVANGGTRAFGIVTLHPIPVVPPADWAKRSLIDTADVAHNRYWIGLRTTTDTALPVLPENITLQAQPMKGAGSVGIPAPETETYTQATVVARDTALAATTLIVANLTTGAHAAVVVGANSAIANSVISLPVTRGDQLVVAQPLGHPTVNLGDGAIYLS